MIHTDNTQTLQNALAEIERLKAELDLALSTIESRDRNLAAALDEHIELRAKLAALEGQEPVGTYTVSKYKGYENTEYQISADLPEGTHNLYAAAGAAPKEKP